MSPSKFLFLLGLPLRIPWFCYNFLIEILVDIVKGGWENFRTVFVFYPGSTYFRESASTIIPRSWPIFVYDRERPRVSLALFVYNLLM